MVFFSQTAADFHTSKTHPLEDRAKQGFQGLGHTSFSLKLRFL